MQPKPNDTNPFSNLAFELLGNIFIHCLPQGAVIISPTSAPLLLVQVCRQWREVAFATPTLWQTITLGEMEKCIDIFDLFLAKSGSLPLIITLPPSDPLGSVYYEMGKQPPEKAMMDRILDNFHRISFLEGFTHFEFALSIFKRLRVPNTPHYIHAPLLKYLDITGVEPLTQSRYSENQIEKATRGCIISPNIEELHLRKSQLTRSIFCFSPETLRVLRGFQICAGDMAKLVNDVSLLSRATNLEALDISLYHIPSVLQLPLLPSVYLPSLKAIRLDISISCGNLIYLISLFDFPNIEKLDLELLIDVTSHKFSSP